MPVHAAKGMDSPISHAVPHQELELHVLAQDKGGNFLRAAKTEPVTALNLGIGHDFEHFIVRRFYS